ncbi:MAG: lactonase family protein [Holophagales bacterium]|nr:lactonase family protein [Holophagales bacterium]
MDLLDAFHLRSGPRARAFATLAMGLSVAAGSLVAATASRAQFHLAPVTADAPNREAAQVEFSATGEHIYVLGSLSNDFTLSRGPILHLYSREPESGSVRYRTSYEPRIPGFEDLRVKAIDSSPDGRHLYLANSDPEQPELDGLWILAIRPTGEIELLDRLPARDSGLSGADRVLATPDGSHVIAAGRTLLVFERDPETGGLTQVQELPRPEARHLVLTADGRYLVAAGSEPALRVYRRDIGTGFLSPAMELPDLDIDGFTWERIELIAPAEGSALVAVVGEFGFFIHTQQVVELTLEDSAIRVGAHSRGVSATGGGLISVAAHPFDGTYQAMLWADNSNCFYLLTYLDQGGSLVELPGSAGPDVCGPEFTGEPDVLAWSGDGKHLYIPSYNLESLAMANSGPAGRNVVLADRPSDGRDGLFEISHLRVAPTTGSVYAIAMGSLSRLDWVDGRLEPRRRMFISAEDQANDVAFVPGTDMALIDFRGSGNTYFARVLEDDGSLELVEDPLPTNLGQDLEVSPDGRHLYLRSSSPFGVDSTYAIHAAETSLELVTDTELPVGRWHFTADGAHIYFYGDPTSFAPVFGIGLAARDSESGAVVTVASTLPGLERAVAAVPSPDGRHLYALLADLEGALSVSAYDRDSESGFVTELQSVGASDLGEFPTGVALTLDASGDTLFAAGTAGGRILTWSREAATGRLSAGPSLPVRLWTGPFSSFHSYGANLRFTADPSGEAVYLADPAGNQVLSLIRGCSLAGPEHLCVGREDRFRVEVAWSDRDGSSGRGRIVPAQSNDSGLFWFFEENNWEMLVKVLDGCDINGKHWVLAAATTDVGYTLTVKDDFTGQHVAYTNDLGTASPSVIDTGALDGCPPPVGAPIEGPPAGEVRGQARPGAAEAQKADEILSLGDGRFELAVDWRTDDDNGTAKVVPAASDDSGLFWFFDENNWEMLVKVLDGCDINGHYWLLAAVTSDVGYELTLRDTSAGVDRSYGHDPGSPAPAIVDVTALATCP